MLTISAHQANLPRMNSQAGYWGKNIHNTYVCQSLIFRIYKELIKFNNKMPNIL